MPVTEFTPVPSLIGGILIGLAAVLLMAATGRIAGVSGFVSRLVPPYHDDQFAARSAFVAGLVVAPLLYWALGGTPITQTVTSNPVLLIAAGILVGFGAVTGSGCTSGHGVCGMARGSVRSFAATATFMLTGMTTVYLTRHVLGG